ncbi:DUF805 domain-containing protein [Massilia pseudoviolaceinigra]|uniref:DUF805 domain-containing protein n=1 Tax=Massilia pseudoviolaceinigra TaxID=3057165 RepID=UPI0027966E31|nr:DUF805 domain-containing protein [Massilia sp. CCM 9206]MDQ1919636.1 DUF805 domain-containing protein [Massilia sp. CCM 9206]
MNHLYAAPAADMTPRAVSGETYVPRMLTMKGRIGRVRYLVYSMVLWIAIMLLTTALIALLVTAFSLLMSLLGLVMLIPALAATFILTRRRLHDMALSGWLGLLHLVPLVNFFFGLWMVFGRGGEGANKYGPPPAPNTRALTIAAWVLPIAFAASMPSILKLQDKWIDLIMGFEAAKVDKTFDPFSARNAPADTASDDAAAASGDASADSEIPAEAPAPAAPKPLN